MMLKVQQRAKHLILLYRRGLGASAHALQQRTDFLKLLLTRVADVSVSHPTIFGTKEKIVNTFSAFSLKRT